MPRRSTTQRGYDAAHKAERKRLAPSVARGEWDCARCREPIHPGTPWDLDHDASRTGYLGPSHASCNRAHGARKRNAQAASGTPSRDWGRGG